MKNLFLGMLASVIFGLGVGAADAATLLSVGGPKNSGSNVGTGGVEAVAVSFTLTNDLNNLALSASISCFVCSGGLYLHSNALGPTTDVGDLVTAAEFSSASSDPYFEDVSLSAGVYFMILEISSGFAIWEGSDAPSVFSSPGVTAGPDFISTDVSGFVPTSSFGILNFNGGLSFELTQAPAVVPLPASMTFSILGLLGLGYMRRKSKTF